MKRFFTLILPLLSLCFFDSLHAALVVKHWQTVAPGIAYTHITNQQTTTLGYIHIFKVNLKKNTIKLALAKDDLFPGEPIYWLAKKNHALLAVNGGFFTASWKPIGLRIQDGKVRSPIQPTPWWHIFYLKNNIPYISTERDYRLDTSVSLALQGGPRLLMNGHIPSLKPGKAERTAIGITRDQQIIILATEHWKLSTTDLAKLFQASESQGGLNCIQALNLDGGSSTQLYANMGQFILNVSSLALITDIVYVISTPTGRPTQK